MDIKEIGIVISQARKRRGITQKDLAAACGLSRATVSALESGKIQELGFGRVKALSDFLDLEFSLSPQGVCTPPPPLP